MTVVQPSEFVRSICPRDCYDSCGLAIKQINASNWHISGDPNDPVSKGKLCAKCALAYNDSVLSRVGRLSSPLRRIGAKGEGRFEEIGWEEATKLIAAKFQSISGAHSPQRILQTHYCGTRSLIARDFPLRFFNRLGAREVIPESICYSAGAAALDYVYGTHAIAFDTRELDQTKCVVLWGVNASASSPHADSMLRHASSKLIVVDPVRHQTARHADLHLQPNPGTDALLAFGLMRLMLSKKTLQRRFIAEHTIGFEKLEQLIKQVKLETVARITDIPISSMERFCDLYAPGPSVLWMGMGLQRRELGGNAIRAVSTLPALTGNLGRPGAGLIYVNGMGARGIDYDYLSGSHLRSAPDQPVAHPDLVEVLRDEKQSLALFCWNNNIVASCPRQDELKLALAREDLFTVVADPYQTDTANYADIVLPAADFTEFDDMVYSYLFMTMGPQVGFRAPLGQSLRNSEIFRLLARAMNFEEPELYEDDRTIMTGVLQRMGWTGSLDDFLAAGNRYWPNARTQFSTGIYATPSRKIELLSKRAIDNGLSGLPLPLHETPPLARTFRLLSPGDRWLSNSSFGQFPEIRRRLRSATIFLHPADAEILGVQRGQSVKVTGSAGSIKLELGLSADLKRGVALSYKNRWPRYESGGRSINAIISARRADYGNCFAPHSEIVTVEPLQ